MNQKFTPYIYIAIFYTLIQIGFSQEKILHLKIVSSDSIENKIIKSINYQETFYNTKNLFKTKDSVINALQEKGYFTLSTIKNSKKNNQFIFDLSLGEKIIKAILTFDVKDKTIIDRLDINKTKNKLNVDIEHLKSTIQTIKNSLIKNGETFTKIQLTDIKIKKTTLHAKLFIQRKQKRTIDKVIIKGYKNFPSSHLAHFYKINKNTIFNKELINKVSKQTYKLSFAKEFKRPEILFSRDSTILYMYLNKEKASVFDGLINFSTENKTIKFRGHLNLKLTNTFNYGEKLEVYWKNNGNRTQSFNFKTHLPYLFKSKFSTNLNLEIFRQDSTFTNVITNISLSYPISDNSNLSLTYNNEKSSTTNNIFNIDNFHKRMFGFGYSYSSISLNKFHFNINTLFGKKINTNSNQILISFNLLKKISLSKKIDLVITNKTNKLFSESILTNELFREGGINSIRGFKEQSILTSAFSYFKNEFRLKQKNNSYLYSIHDIGLFKLKNKTKTLFSLGLGYLINNSTNSIEVTKKGQPFVRNICMSFDLLLQRKQPDVQLFSMTV